MFRTKLHTKKQTELISHSDKLMFFGSCFTENIGNKLQSYKFNTDINPFGILYNPISIKKAVHRILSEREFEEDELFCFNERWNSFMHHGKFSHADIDVTLKHINSQLNASAEFIKEANYLFITFGSAWVYEDKKTQQIVANCHKLPSNNFMKRLLNADEITVEYFQLLNSLYNFNSDIKVVLTISPVRHLKDGFVENNLSKSVLSIAINQIIEHFRELVYFPVYEIMNDDLRDYRFYETDLLHPNETAVNYIFDKFSNSFFNEETKNLTEKIGAVNNARNHKIFRKDSESTVMFAKNSLEKINELEKLNSEIDLSEEKKYFTGLSSVGNK